MYIIFRYISYILWMYICPWFIYENRPWKLINKTTQRVMPQAYRHPCLLRIRIKHVLNHNAWNVSKMHVWAFTQLVCWNTYKCVTVHIIRLYWNVKAAFIPKIKANKHWISQAEMFTQRTVLFSRKFPFKVWVVVWVNSTTKKSR